MTEQAKQTQEIEKLEQALAACHAEIDEWREIHGQQTRALAALREERDAFRDEANALRRNYLRETKDLAERADTAEALVASLTEARDGLQAGADDHLQRANEEIARRERAQIAYTQSEQKRLVLIDKLAALTAAHARLRTLSAKWRAYADDVFDKGAEFYPPEARQDASRARCDADELDVALAPPEGSAVATSGEPPKSAEPGKP